MTVSHAASALAAHLVKARRNRVASGDVEADLLPADEAAAYEVQDRVAALMGDELGPVMGWKVGASSASSEPSAAPLHRDTIFADGATIPKGLCRFQGVEAEIAYRFAGSLPKRDAPWTEEEVFAAIGSVHAAIEVVDTRFRAPKSQPPLAHLADQSSHGVAIIGPGKEDWRDILSTDLVVMLKIDGVTACTHKGGNTAGDTRRLLVWLANHAMRRGLPITAGTVVITGSTTGTLFEEGGHAVEASFDELPPVHAYLSGL
ncbi:2-keto-4-pentenoate hydratase [Brytella acorum]|uniref:Fumarylacetoacetate hydrolase family protein n=1 Tax=Brytella acorum TaxID=2959299 RepID=A0AA35UGZ4_9PROT|nr:fumarylacetoacetate hydrolase family protein [Brytella acorum]MDF3623738.1 fumarylacetoacetate hydrolase family protein [Brytella acorum]CAI9119844.1 fumarylacetoacetate hydrolase family protein [Brytella acorum]